MAYIGNKPTDVPLTSADITDGTITESDLSSSVLTLARNDIINGGYLINQENNTSATDDSYSIGDLFLYVGENSSTTSLQTSGGPQGDRNFARINVDNANAQAGWVYFLTNDDCQDYIANGALSFGIKAKTTSGAIDTIRIGILKWTGTADSVTSDVVGTWASDGTDPTLATNWSYENTPSDLNLTTSWQRFTVENVTVDSDTNNIAIFIWIDDGTITANDQLDVTEWQLNPGATVNDFSSGSKTEELKKVEYFLERNNFDSATNEFTGLYGFQSTTTLTYAFWKLRTPKRAVPTFTFSDGATFNVHYKGDNSVNETGGSLATEIASPYGARITFDHSAVGTAGDGIVIFRDGTDTAWIQSDIRL